MSTLLASCASLSSAMNAPVSRSLPKPRASVVWINLPDGAVLFSPETEIYYGLNNVGAVIWGQLLESIPSIDLLCGAVHERFPDATLEQIRDDVLELLDDFSANGLVDSAEENLGG